MKKEKKNIWLVGDYTSKLPIMVVKFIKGKNNFCRHKVLARFKTKKEAILAFNIKTL